MTLHEAPRPPLLAASWTRCSALYGCEGRAAEPFTACPAHLRPREFERFVASLRPGADLDLRGVTITPGLLDVLLDAVTGPDQRPHLGRSRFDGALLPAQASMRGACFEGDCSFDDARFEGGFSFFDARFLGHLSFRWARFTGNASFHAARFQRHATFDEAVFGGDALFGETAWGADASFARTVFMGAAAFDQARFSRDAAMPGACFGGAASFRHVQVGRHVRFDRARFRRGLWLGPLVAEGRIGLANVSAQSGLCVHAAAEGVALKNAVVRGDGDFRLRQAELTLQNASFDGRVTVRTLPQPLNGLSEPESWRALAKVVSLHGMAAQHLELADLDLSQCRFLGMTHPDRLTLSGSCTFATGPGRRDIALAEDLPGPVDGTRLAVLYGHLADATTDPTLTRQLRYRALEARRHTDPVRRRRWLLHILWVTCGYGQRTGRAALWLAVLAAIVCGGLTVIRHGQHHRASRARPTALAWRLGPDRDLASAESLRDLAEKASLPGRIESGP